MCSLKQEVQPENYVCPPALYAIITCYGPLRHLQTELEASYAPILSKVPLMLEYLKQKMTILSLEIATASGMRNLYDLKHLLASTRPQYLNEILVHDLQGASRVIKPSLKYLSLRKSTDCNVERLTEESLINKMLREHQAEKNNVRKTTVTTSTITPFTGNLGTSSCLLAIGMSF